MSGGGKNNFFHKYGGALSLLSGSPAALAAPVEDIVKKNQVKGQGTTAPGGYANTMLDPADIFGGKKTGEAQQAVKQQAAEQTAQAGIGQSDLDAILAGGHAPIYGADGLPIASVGGNQPPAYGGGMAGYQPNQILYPNLLPSPTGRTQDANHMPLLAQRSFNQTMAPFAQPNWGVPQVNPAYLTGISRFPNGQVPNGSVMQPQGIGQLPQRQGIQPINQTPLNQRAWS